MHLSSKIEETLRNWEMVRQTSGGFKQITCSSDLRKFKGFEGSVRSINLTHATSIFTCKQGLIKLGEARKVGGPEFGLSSTRKDRDIKIICDSIMFITHKIEVALNYHMCIGTNPRFDGMQSINLVARILRI